MLHEIDENRLSGAKPNLAKVMIFRGATINDMKDFLKLYLKCSQTNIILHVGINDSSRAILNKLLSLKNFIHTELPESNVILSNIIDRPDSSIARLKISNFNRHLNCLKIDTIDNDNILSEHLNGSSLHLNRHGKGKLDMNLIKKLRELRKKTLIEIDNKVDSLWLGLSTMFQIVYVIMIVKESRVQQVLNIF